jgi:8-oxo-dGTP pyrophosphatase MutT (NUDIX family)
MAGWKTLSSEKVYETAWFKVRRDKAINHHNQELTYSVMELHNPSVTIAAMDDQGRILLQRQYRYPIDKTIWEFPAGHSDGEEFLTAAKRELSEETGLSSDNWTDLGRINVAIGVANIQSQLFLAKNVQKTAEISDEEEDIGEQRFVPLAEIEELALTGELIDASVLSALYLIKLRQQENA